MGGIYARTAPKINAAEAPGRWQKFVIDFRAPKFDNDGKKIANAKLVKCTLNGQVIHENVEIAGPTTGAMSRKETAAGPLMLQGNHGPIAYRNIKIKPGGGTSVRREVRAMWTRRPTTNTTPRSGRSSSDAYRPLP